MNNDELVTRRAQAIAEDRCFSKGRLRDEFRRLMAACLAGSRSEAQPAHFS
ncbi:hypothetical protein ECDEC6E_1876 [Escherichia coli DEC6E]|nr:hypothetical protein ECDEC6E_1876 [Escherichia coli DEC6E]EHV79807.1 hypothetical protein ECDEC6D_5247 [Escherichia coli DEC6D]